jgi:hypothetical protein
MGKKDKQLNRLMSLPNNFTYDELKQFMNWLGYNESNAGKASGSRVTFVNIRTKAVFKLHKPHPGNTLKLYQVKSLIQFLKDEGDI